ncbi:hypothetical protein SP41_60 [Salmonella phage 41]|nr:hypothetical protein SP41_60 [Salmonella phage 41]
MHDPPDTPGWDCSITILYWCPQNHILQIIKKTQERLDQHNRDIIRSKAEMATKQNPLDEAYLDKKLKT